MQWMVVSDSATHDFHHDNDRVTFAITAPSTDFESQSTVPCM